MNFSKTTAAVLFASAAMWTSSAQASLLPSDILTAYGIGTTQATYTGAGQTIAIYTSSYYSGLQTDIDNFSNKYMSGVSTAVYVTNTSGTNLTGTGSSPSAELALDVEYAHLVAPGAKIDVVYDSSLSYAAYYAAHTLKASVVNISYGSYDSSLTASSKTSSDGNYSAAVKAGAAVFASAGDSGNYDFPASSPYVVGVGGTNLYVSSGKYSSETGWTQTSGDTTSGGGGGVSTSELLPTYQQVLITKGDLAAGEKYRVGPDVSIAGGPDSAVPIYENTAVGSTSYTSYNYGSSLASPLWAGIIALADQARAANGLTPLNSTDLLTILYGLYGGSTYSTYFHDITGTASNSNGFAVTSGFDELTGLGSPKVNALVPYLATAVAPEPGSLALASVAAGCMLRRRRA